MENFLRGTNGKKVAALVILLTIFFLVFIVWSTSKVGNKTPPTSDTKNSPIPTSSKPNQDYKSVNFVGDGFSVAYPSTWNKQTLPVFGGGALTHFYSPTKSGGESFPRVDIQATPISSTSATISELINNLSPLKLTQDTVVFHGQTAIRLSGLIPIGLKSVNPRVVNSINKTFLFFIYNNRQYIIDYVYKMDGNEEASVEIINKVLDSYTF